MTSPTPPAQATYAAHARRHRRSDDGRVPSRRRNSSTARAATPMTRARFPDTMPGPLQYGPGVKAYVVHLLAAQMLSLKRVAHSMHALIGQLLSEATLLGYVGHLHRAPRRMGAPRNRRASSRNRRCTSTRPRCAWTERITGFTSTSAGTLTRGMSDMAVASGREAIDGHFGIMLGVRERRGTLDCWVSYWKLRALRPRAERRVQLRCRDGASSPTRTTTPGPGE